MYMSIYICMNIYINMYRSGKHIIDLGNTLLCWLGKILLPNTHTYTHTHTHKHAHTHKSGEHVTFQQWGCPPLQIHMRKYTRTDTHTHTHTRTDSESMLLGKSKSVPPFKLPDKRAPGFKSEVIKYLYR